jgi:hypothetical protein
MYPLVYSAKEFCLNPVHKYLLLAGAKSKKLKKIVYSTINVNSHHPFLWKIAIQNNDVSKFHVSPIF